jgi:hypothetical protein
LWEKADTARPVAGDPGISGTPTIVDLRDGTADGKVAPKPKRCPKCDAMISPKFGRCLFCGHQDASAPIVR